MKEKFVAVCITILILTSCSDYGDNVKDASVDTLQLVKDVQISKMEFHGYLKTLDTIPLPLYHNVKGILPEISQNYSREGFELFKHVWTSKPLGILFADDSVVTLIECSVGDWGLTPFLVTYDMLGNKIDSLGPYVKSGEDMGYYAIEYVTISADKTIVVSDTVRTYQLNDDSTDIDSETKKITTGITKYIIGYDGRIRAL